MGDLTGPPSPSPSSPPDRVEAVVRAMTGLLAAYRPLLDTPAVRSVRLEARIEKDGAVRVVICTPTLTRELGEGARG